MLRASLSLALCCVFASSNNADDGNRLACLDECNPWYPHKDFPKLITPQWVGEEGVEAVIVLGIDDMRDPAKYEQYLRPILNRLKQIDGRAPVSIMTCEVKPDDPQLQSWLEEGLSIECHTIDHPCPILQGGDFAKAKSTYDRCVDLMGKIPGNVPVAFRTPCCDSLNTVSPRFFAEIFDGTTGNGNFLQIDSSVFTFFTSEDESLPRELVLDANGKERFLKYMPRGNKTGNIVHNNFVNYIKNYPYPYMINNSCWEIPCIAPSDWSAQHLHGSNNPVTVEDWKAAIDLAVHKQGCFSLVFHPHGWIKPEQVVEMIDHAVAKHGKKVKFLTFGEVAECLNRALSDGASLRVTTPRSPAISKSRASDFGNLPQEIIDFLATPTHPKMWPIRRADGTNNGFFIHDRHFCWQNEDTAQLPDLIYRVSFDEILEEHRREEARKALPPVPVGAAVVDITPDYPVRLTGYGSRMKESEGVAARIHARALVIGGSRIEDRGSSESHGSVDSSPLPNSGEKGKGEGVAANVQSVFRASSPLIRPSASAGNSTDRRNENSSPEFGGEGTLVTAQSSIVDRQTSFTVLITVDTCAVPKEVTEAVFARIAAKHGITRERFAISATHSHSAPWLRDFAPNIFAEIPDDHAAHLAQYEAELIEKLVDVVDEAIAARRPGHLSSGFGEANFAMNRRLLSGGKWANFGEVPDGPTDKRVPVLAAHDVDGKLIAVLANYACHCTTETGDFNQISGDWAGFAADLLEVDHPGAVALIAIGCGADANPSPRGTHEQAKVHGRTMADEVGRVLRGARSGERKAANLSPLPFPGGEGQGEGVAAIVESQTAASSPLIRPSATFSPDLGGEGSLRRIDPNIACRMARIDLPLGPLPSRADWEQQAKDQSVTGSRARYFLKMLDEGQQVPSTIPDYPVQTWCFGKDLAMVFLGGEVVVDYSIRMNDMFDSDRLWINAYSNDVPCYIASARVLREGGYEADFSMLYYRRPTRLAPEAEDLICDAVQKLMPHEFYSEELQREFPGPKSPEESLKCMTTKPDLRVVLAASEPLIRNPVAFDWDERGRLWVVEMGDYPGTGTGIQESGFRESQDATSPAGSAPESRIPDPESSRSAGRVRVLEDLDHDGVYDKATTFLDGLAFPNGIHCWRGGAIITMAPDIFYAEDTDGDGSADVREALYTGFTEGNQQHRVNGLRWGLDGWLYLANGDSGGQVRAVGTIPFVESDQWRSYPSPADFERHARVVGGNAIADIRGRDLRIHPDTGGLDTVSGQTQFGRERDDYGNWFGNNNSNPIWQYVLEDRYVRRNPHARIADVIAPVSVIPGAAPVYPTSKTLARFNDFGQANRFTSACSTMIYRDTYLGEQYYGNAFTSEPVHNLVSRLVMTRDGINFKGERAADEQQSEFLASTDNWFRPTMIRTGPDGAIWVADMYRAVIEHPEWIPPEYQRKMDLYAGSDRGRIYRIVPASACCGENLSPLPISGGEGQGEGVALRDDERTAASSPLIRPSASVGNSTDRRSENGSPDLGGEGTVKAEPQISDLRSAFTQPWNEIPIAELVARLESPNGWWRDTAQRILTHRVDEIDNNPDAVGKVMGLAIKSRSISARAQAAATISLIPSLAESPYTTANLFGVSIASDKHADVRCIASLLLESNMRSDSEETRDVVAGAMRALADDPDPAVRLQLILSLGEAKGDSAAALLGQMLRNNFDIPMMRSAGLTSLTPDNIGGVLKEALNGPAEGLNEDLIGILLAQAAAMGKYDQLSEPLTVLVNSITNEAAEARFELVGETLNGVLNRDAAKILKQTPTFFTAMSKAAQVAAAVAADPDADGGQRAAALRFAVIAGSAVSKPVDVAVYFSPQTPTAVQLAAISAVEQNSDPKIISWLLTRWNSLDPLVRAELLSTVMRRESTTSILLDAIESNTGAISATDLDATQRDSLVNHRNDKIAAQARKLLADSIPTNRIAVVEDFKSQISNLKSDAVAGKAVFEKRCGICHKLQDVGKEIGADLSALKDRSTEALLTGVLDPNRAVETKFLMYTVVTKDGLQHTGMLKGETGGSLTLIGSEGKEVTVVRADIEELLGSKRSLMPEGIEKDIPAQDLANVFAFVQSTGTPWKRFEGNSPQFVESSSDGTITLPASAAEIYGPSLVFEPKYGNLGYWSSTEDYAKWTFEVPRSGHWTVEFDCACDDGTAGSLIRLSTGTRMLTARVPGSGSWDTYQTWTAGTIDLHRGRGQLIITAPENPQFALLDLRAVRLVPPK